MEKTLNNYHRHCVLVGTLKCKTRTYKFVFWLTVTDFQKTVAMCRQKYYREITNLIKLKPVLNMK